MLALDFSAAGDALASAQGFWTVMPCMKNSSVSRVRLRPHF